MSIKGQKLVENAKIENLKCDILGDFKHCELWQILDKNMLRNNVQLLEPNGY